MEWTGRILRRAIFPAALALCAAIGLVPSHAVAETMADAPMIERGLSAEERGDYVEALKVWEQLAARGDDRAMTNAGVIYQNGEGVPIDNEKALDWYLKAMNGTALNNMGVMYRDGAGVPRNRKVAYLLFLTVHMEGLGGEENVMRANRNLRREIAELPQQDRDDALCYTMRYLKAYIESRGKLVGMPDSLQASQTRPRVRELDWWGKHELDPYTCPADT